MGSGLILLVIVGAWLAVLVPMALRSQDVRGSQAADRFHDAMRVLSRRPSSSAASRKGPGGAPEPAVEPETVLAPEPVPAPLPTPPAVRRARAAAAARRRRLLLVLLALAVATLAGGLLGPRVVLVGHAVVDLLIVAFVVHLRRIAVARAERDWRAAMAQRQSAASPADARAQTDAVAAAAVVVRAPAHVAGIPDRMPPRPAPLEVTGLEVVVPAARTEELLPARGAQGEAWSPVPVPAPTYLSAPVVPRPAAPAAHADGLADAERELGIVDEGPQLDEILDRRRAVNEW